MWFLENSTAVTTAKARMNSIIQIKNKQNPHTVHINSKKIKLWKTLGQLRRISNTSLNELIICEIQNEMVLLVKYKLCNLTQEEKHIYSPITVTLIKKVFWHLLLDISNPENFKHGFFQNINRNGNMLFFEQCLISEKEENLSTYLCC